MLARIRDKLDGSANPLVIRAVYQSVHSRALMASFWIMLTVAVLGYYGVYASATRADEIGEGMLGILGAALGAMGIFVIPYAAFSEVHGEISSGAIDLVKITGLSARRLARGQLLAAAVRLALLYSLVAPFAVTSYVFGGVDLAALVLLLDVLIISGLLACAGAVFMASVACYPGMRAIAKWAFMALVLIGIPVFLTVYAELYDEFGYSSIEATDIVFVAWLTVGALLAVAFLGAAAANALSPPSARSSARGKVILLAFLLVLLAAAVTIALAHGGDWEQAAVFVALLGGGALLLASLGWLTADPPAPGARARRRWRWLVPLRDTPGGALAFLIAGVGVCAAGVAALLIIDARSGYVDDDVVNGVICLLAMAFVCPLYLSGIARAVTAPMRPAYRTPTARRLVVAAFLVGSIVVAIIVGASVGWWRLGRLNGAGAALIPALYVVTLDDPPNVFQLIVHMAIPLTFGLLVHLMVCARALRRKEVSPAG